MEKVWGRKISDLVTAERLKRSSSIDQEQKIAGYKRIWVKENETKRFVGREKRWWESGEEVKEERTNWPCSQSDSNDKKGKREMNAHENKSVLAHSLSFRPFLPPLLFFSFPLSLAFYLFSSLPLSISLS